MRVLIVRGLTGERKNDPGWYFRLVLQKLGVECDLFEHPRIVRQHLLGHPGFERILRRYPRIGGWIDIYRKADRMLVERVEDYEPDLILVMNGKTLRPEVLRKARQVAPRAIIANVFGDNPFFYEIAFASLPEYDRFYIKDSFVLREMKKFGATNVAYMPHACYPDEHRPLEDITKEERIKYGSDLSFVGSMYPYRARILDVLRDYESFKIWGQGFWGPIPKDSVAYTRHQWQWVTGREKVVVFNATKINLNVQNFQNDIFGVSSKVHQIAACGGFQLVDYKPDLEIQYKIGEEVIAFRDAEELREKVAYYLRHPDERAGVAARGRERALQEHTFAHRLHQIFHDFDLGEL